MKAAGREYLGFGDRATLPELEEAARVRRSARNAAGSVNDNRPARPYNHRPTRLSLHSGPLPMPPQLPIETHNLGKRYGRVVALQDCSLQIPRGEVFGLLGPNGAGKTTLLRLLLGFLAPTTGWARVEGFDCHRDALQVHARVAYLPGEARLFRRLKGRDVLRFFGRLRRQGDPARARRLAERLDVDLNRTVATSSTGMRQKLALAVVMSLEVPVLILDEPTTNLDPTTRSIVLQLVREARGVGRTVLFSSHILSEVEEVCDRVALLRAGQVVHLQAMSELRRQHRILADLARPVSPAELQRPGLSVQQLDARRVVLETADELSPLLSWLSGLPLAEVRIEPLGLKAVYDRYEPVKRLEG
jgi:ABC-2 type transport system ATP-binding protein